MSDRSGRKVMLTAAIMALALSGGAWAADITWDGDTDDDLFNAANWVENAVGDGDSGLFGNVAGSHTPAVSATGRWFRKFTFAADAPTYAVSGSVARFELDGLVGTVGNDLVVNNSANYQVLSPVNNGTGSFWISGYLNAANGDIVVNAPIAVGANTTDGKRWLNLAGGHDIYFNVDPTIHPAGDVNGGTWTSSTTTSMWNKVRGRFFMTNFAGRAYMGNIGTSYRGGIHVDSTANGALRLTHNNALGRPNGSNTGGAVYIYGGADHNGTIELANDVSVTRWVLYMNGRSGAVADDPHFLNVSGNNTLNVVGDWNTGIRVPITTTADSSTVTTAAGNWNIQSDSGKLTIALTGVDPFGTIYNTENVAINLQLMGAGDGQIDAPVKVYQANPSLTLTKKGTGTWTLTNATNDYTGATTIEAGTLSLGTTGTVAMSSAITVKSGATFDVSGLAGGYTLGSAQALKGRGLVNSAVTTVAGSSIAPGDTAAGTLSINNGLTLGDGTTLAFDLSPTPGGANDKLAVAGDVTVGGMITVAITPVQGYLSSGSYRLVDYSGAALSASNFTLTGLANTARQTFTLGFAANQVNLVVTGDPAALIWKGGLNANAWDVNATANWTRGAGNEVFFNNDLVTFDNSGANAAPVNAVNVVVPGSVTFAQSAGHDYTLSGGNVAIVAGLTSNGTGNTTFTNAALTVNGNLTVNGSGIVSLQGGDVTLTGSLNGSGTVNLANTGSLSPVLALDSGTLIWNRMTPMIDTVFTGGGAIRKASPTDTTLISNNPGFTGPIEVAAGVLRVDSGNTTALGTGTTGGTTVLPGATLDVRGTKLGTEVVTIAGSGAGGELGALVDAGDTGTAQASRALLGGVILAGDATIGSTAKSYPFVDDTAPGAFFAGNGHNLTMQGYGEWDFYGLGETHLANITLRNAATYFGTTTTLGDAPGVVRLQDGGYLGLDGSPTVTKSIVVDPTGGGVTAWNNNNAIQSPILMNGDFEGLVFSLANSATVYNNPVLTIQGQLTGAGAFRVHCSPRNTTNAAVRAHDLGTVALTSDVNNYTGGTFIGGGGGFSQVTADNDNITLMLGNGGTTGQLPPGPIVDNGRLSFNRTDAIVFANNISGTGGVSLEAVGGTVTLTSNNTYTGGTAINAGTLIIAGSHTGAGTYTLADGASLNIAGMTTLPLNTTGLVASGSVTLTMALATPSSTTDNVFLASTTLDLGGLTAVTLNVTALGGGQLADGHYLLAAVDPSGTFTTPATDMPALTYNGPAAPGQNPRLTVVNETYHKAVYLTLGNPPPPPAPFALRPDVQGADPSGPDGDVDFDDYLVLVACMNNGGPSVLRAEGCETMDFDQDNDVDLADFGVWQRCFSGANIQARVPECTLTVR